MCDCLSITRITGHPARRPHVPVAAHASPSACCEAPTPDLHRQNCGCEISPPQIVITAPQFRPVLKIWTDPDRTKVRHHMVLSRFPHTHDVSRIPNFTTVRASGQPGGSMRNQGGRTRRRMALRKPPLARRRFTLTAPTTHLTTHEARDVSLVPLTPCPLQRGHPAPWSFVRG